MRRNGRFPDRAQLTQLSLYLQFADLSLFELTLVSKTKPLNLVENSVAKQTEFLYLFL
ncbi:hypothetical protein GGD50_005754 [Rhizobium paranaense]|uniref:Uncharacterized protein n=1 Tax=Rhizobium paranaense TaxID=1650438 RepID=A0A7W8XWX3_9HYPH|nr:hypothetical protein [Rhizobium paranaense]